MYKKLHIRYTTDTQSHQEIKRSIGSERGVADWYRLVCTQLACTL